jgi:hypothetical protein
VALDFSDINRVEGGNVPLTGASCWDTTVIFFSVVVYVVGYGLISHTRM